MKNSSIPSMFCNSRAGVIPVKNGMDRVWFWVLTLSFAATLKLSAVLPSSRDTTFQTLAMDGLPNATVLLPDGRILIGGSFQNIGGVSRPALARLNANGSLDTTFAPPVGGAGLFGKPTVYDLQVLSDGRILAAGTPAFRTTGSILRTNVIRFNADGSVDSLFDAGDLSFWRGLAVHADGRAVISYTTPTSPFRPGRLTSTGALDPTFNYSIPFQSGMFPLQFFAQNEGRTLVLFGDNDATRNGLQQLQRLNVDGSVDSSFKFSGVVGSLVDDSPVALASDGRILVSVVELSNPAPVVTRLSADGTRDPGFVWSGPPNAQRLYPVGAAFLPDGGVIAVRQPTAGDRKISFYYLNSSGVLLGSRELPNAAFDNGVVGLGTISARAFAVQPDGKLLFAAGFLDGSQNVFGMFRMPPPPVPAPPVITLQPQSQTIGAGDFLGLSVTATSDSALSYRWYHASTNLVPVQTNAFLSLSNASDERAGEFFAVVSNAFGAVTSQVATITVRPPAPMIITQQPQGGTVRLSQSFGMFVRFQAEVNAGFLWYKNGVPLAQSGGQAFGLATLNLAANDATRAGDYFAIITNAYGGSITSAVAHVDLIFPGPPQFTLQPQDLALFSNQPVVLTATAIGDGTPVYRWMHEGTNLVAGTDIPSVTGPTLSIGTRRADRFGSYSVVATLTPGGSTTSRVAVVTLLPSGPPVVTFQPLDLRLTLGDRTNLAAGFNAQAPVTVMWQHSGTNLLVQTFNTLDSASSNFLPVVGTFPSAGDYRFIATNRFGAVTSRVATVEVQSPPGAEIRKDLLDLTVMIGEFNVASLGNGLIVTNCCGSMETTHILSLRPNGGTAPFPVEGDWHLGVGASNRFYVGAQSGFSTVIGTWGYVPGANGFTGLWLTNFPSSGNVSRLETFDDGRYSVGLNGSSAFQSGTFRVLGQRRAVTNSLFIEVTGTNTVNVTWYKDGAAIGTAARGARNYLASSESLGTPPIAGGVNSRFRLTIPDVVPTDAGRYWAVIDSYVTNPDSTFGQPGVLLYNSTTSRVAVVSMKGYAEGEAPEILAASAFGGSNSADELTAMEALSGNEVLLATRSVTFGAGGSQQTFLNLRSGSGELLASADLQAETLNRGPIGTVKALASDGDGGAYVTGDGASGTLDPWFLRRVRPSISVSNGVTNRTYTNLWTARVAGPFTNGLDNLQVPRGAEAVGVVRSGDGVLVAGLFKGKTRFGVMNVVTNPLIPQLTAQVGGVTLTNAYDAAFGRHDGSRDIYLAKYDGLGQMLWVKQYGGTNSETLTTLLTGSDGSIYLAGSFAGTFTIRTAIGQFTIESTRSVPANGVPLYATDGFVARLTASGDPVWIRNIGGIRESAISDTTIVSAAVDGRGEVTFLATRAAGSAFLQPGLTASARYLGRLNAGGELLWTQELGTSGGGQLVAEPSGNVLFVDSIGLSGQTNSVAFGAGVLSTPAWAGAVAAKFAPNGSLLWFRSLDEKLSFVDEARSVTPQKISLTPGGELVVAGKIAGGVGSNQSRSAGQRFDRFELVTTNSGTANPSDVFLLRLSNSYVPSAPRFSLQPLSQTALLQDRVVMEGLAEGYPVAQYQWLVDGKPLAGATSRVLVIPEVSRTNRGVYTLIASNALGVVTSDAVSLVPQLRPNMTGWALVTSSTNYLGIPQRASVDDAGNFQLLHNELSRGSSVFLDGFRSDGSLAWRFQETVNGVFPIQNSIYSVQSRLSPLTLPGGEIFVAGKIQINRLQGAGSVRNFLGRLNPVDGRLMWTTNELGGVTSSIAALDVQGREIRALLTDRTLHRFDFDGRETGVATLANVPSTVVEANSRTALDRDGGYYFYANRVETLNLGPTNFPALGTPGAQTFVLAKFDSAGLLAWHRIFSGQGSGSVEPFNLLVAADGDAILAGRAGVGSVQNYRFQIGTNNVNGYSYTARISAAGEVRWAKAWWLKVDDSALGPNGTIILGGWFRNNPTATPGDKQINFGTNRVSAAGTYDVFAASLDGQGNERWIRQSGSPNFVTFDNARDAAVAVNAEGSVWLGGFSQLPSSAASIDLGDVHYTWPDLRPYNIGNLFGDLPSYFVARLEPGSVTPAVAEISYAPPAPGSNILHLSWPAGFRLQYRETLFSGEWRTLEVQPPYDADIRATQQGYYRVIRGQ